MTIRYKVRFCLGEAMIYDTESGDAVGFFPLYPADYNGMRLNCISFTPGWKQAQAEADRLNAEWRKEQQ